MGPGAAGGLVFGLPDALADDAKSKVGVPSAILIIVAYTSSVVV